MKTDKLFRFLRDGLDSHGFSPIGVGHGEMPVRVGVEPLSNTDALPGGYERGGVLTPATGLGEVLVERLREAEMIIEINTA